VKIASARIRAALVYLAASALVATLVFVSVFFLWYPGPFFAAAGGLDLLKVIVSVDVTLGPLIVLVIYKPGKWGLKFDLVTLAVLQMVALAYGVYVLFAARPVYVVFVKDRFEIARANGYPEEALDPAKAREYRHFSFTGPEWVGARLPENSDEAFKLMVSGMAGVDAQYYPQYYVPFDRVRDEVKAHVLAIDLLRQRNPTMVREVDADVAATGKPEGAIGFVPMRAGKSDLTVIVDRASGEILRVSVVPPWGLI
jgi:hypothetical protein